MLLTLTRKTKYSLSPHRACRQLANAWNDKVETSYKTWVIGYVNLRCSHIWSSHIEMYLRISRILWLLRRRWDPNFRWSFEKIVLEFFCVAEQNAIQGSAVFPFFGEQVKFFLFFELADVFLCQKDVLPTHHTPPNMNELLGQWFGRAGTSWATHRERPRVSPAGGGGASLRGCYLQLETRPPFWFCVSGAHVAE